MRRQSFARAGEREGRRFPCANVGHAVPVDDRERGPSAVGRRHVMSPVAQLRGVQGEQVGLIVDDQYPRSCLSPPNLSIELFGVMGLWLNRPAGSGRP